MSSIIDALKKSDSNRNTETGKNINQIKFGQEPSKPKRKGFWVLVVLLIMIAFGVFAWQQGWHHSLINKVKSWTQTDAPQPQADKPVNNQAQRNNQDDTKPDNKLTPPTTEQVRAKSVAAELAKSQSNQPETSNPENPETEEIMPRDGKAQRNQNDSTDEQITVVKNNRTEPKDRPVIKSDEQEDKTRADKTKDDSMEPTLKQDYLLIHQIDFELRKNIPPIKLNIHIYDPEPKNRMIMMNGVKYQIGDIIADLVSVEDINKEGVVLQFEGVKFLIPK